MNVLDILILAAAGIIGVMIVILVVTCVVAFVKWALTKIGQS